MPDDEDAPGTGGHDPPPDEAILPDPEPPAPSPRRVRKPRKPRHSKTLPPSPPIPPSLQDAILEAAAGPKSVTIDGQTVQAHDLKQLIDADHYLAARKAAGRPAVRFTKMIPPGAE